MKDLSPPRLAADRGAFGSLRETFVVSEVLKLASWPGQRYTLSHYDGDTVIPFGPRLFAAPISSLWS